MAAVIFAAGYCGQPLGTWKLNVSRSTFTGEIRPKFVTLRIETRTQHEVFTVERTEGNGRTTVSSTVLYLDGVARDFQEGECSGTQSSRRIDSQTIEILRTCGPGVWARLTRRIAPKNAIILEISEQRADGRRFDRRLVFEKQ